ncbi:MAG: glycosyltransferase family 9 protein [Nitrososphaerota archaeon]|nr:glycosyltransferase family 9 protein [Nitrososphaerota archaeon]
MLRPSQRYLKSHFALKKNYIKQLILDRPMMLIFNALNPLVRLLSQQSREADYLFLGPTHLGDLLMLSPAVGLLKKNSTGGRVFVVTGYSMKSLATDHLRYDGICEIELPWYGVRQVSHWAEIKSFIALMRLLAQRRPRVVFNYSTAGYHLDYLASWLSGIPERVGFGHKGMKYLLTRVIEFRENEVVAARLVRMIAAWGGFSANGESLRPMFSVGDSSRISARTTLAHLGMDLSQPVVGIGVGAQHSFLWPNSRWIEFCKRLHLNYKSTLVFLGTGDVTADVDSIRSNLPFVTHSLTGQTSLEHLAAVISILDLLVTVDTGLRHLAASMGTRSVVIRHSADRSSELGEYVISEKLVQHHLPCSPCGARICPLGTVACMSEISAQEVLTAFMKFLPHSN